VGDLEQPGAVGVHRVEVSALPQSPASPGGTRSSGHPATRPDERTHASGSSTGPPQNDCGIGSGAGRCRRCAPAGACCAPGNPAATRRTRSPYPCGDHYPPDRLQQGVILRVPSTPRLRWPCPRSRSSFRPTTSEPRDPEPDRQHLTLVAPVRVDREKDMLEQRVAPAERDLAVDASRPGGRGWSPSG
jgi:hypothetical protein